MLRATLSSLMAHKLRLALTALAIVLGVGFVSGTFVLTDTINSVFDDLFATTTKGTDVDVRSREAFRGDDSGPVREPVPASLEATIKAVPGVRATQGNVQGFAQLIGKDGKPIQSRGAPTLAQSFGPVQDLNGSVVARQGRLPSGPDEVVLDARTASARKFAVGDQLSAVLPAGPKTFRLVGIVGFGEVDNLAGATLLGFDLPTAQALFDRKASYDSIDVAGADGVKAEELRDRIGAAVGAKYEAITGQDLAAETTAEVQQGVGFFGTAMLAFAGVALFVGAFIINNTFSIIVAQRTRELALLRCLGASRGQVLRSVLTEAVLVALLASGVGIGFGVLVALGLRGVFSLIGFDLPGGAAVILPRTIIVAFAVGLVVTTVSALLPALRATRVPPVAALRADAVSPSQRSFRRRSIVGGIVTALGVAALAGGLGVFGNFDNQLALVGVGAIVTLLGVGALAPLIAKPLAAVIGWPAARARGLPGNLAQANAGRNPRRTAATAAALMIGLALVSFVTIMASSVKASVQVLFDKAITADYQVTSTSFQPFSPKLAEALAERPEFAVVAPFRSGPFKLDGTPQNLIAADPATVDEVLASDVRSGSMRDLAGGVAVYDELATAKGWTVGSRVPMTFPSGGTQQVTVKAIYGDKSVHGSEFILPLADFERDYPPSSQLDQIVLIKDAAGTSDSAARSAIDGVAAAYPGVQVQDSSEAARSASKSIDQLLLLIYVLLALAVIIALIGIVNTLALSIYERVRELGLLRAVGMDRRQVRTMIRWESVIIAVLGALLGLGVGVFFGWAVVRTLGEQGITEFDVPYWQLALFVVFAGLAGILAAVLPGRRAARVDVLRALAAE